MSSEASSFAEEASNIMLKELQSWWEIPSMAQYISLFRESFNLPEVEIEELENGFIDDTIKGPNEWLRNLMIAFLKSIVPRRINAKNWGVELRKLIRRKWSESPFSEKENPFEEDKPFHELTLRSKVEVLYCVCLYRLDKNDIAEQMKSMDAEALRVQKLGSDKIGNTYWYFYGTRLYKEDASKEKKPWDEEWKEQKRNSIKKKKRRGRPPKRPRSDGESDHEDFKDSSRKSEFMNVKEKSRWSVVCDTIEEWVNFAEKFKNSKSKTEKRLFQIIQENFLPTLNNIYEEKERKLQEKIRELMPVREKIVTRRETRRLRGEPVDYAALNGGYYSDEEIETTPVIKDRAQRLEERNKRASEAENVQIISHKKVKHDKPNSESESSNSSIHEKSESSSDIDVQSQMERLLTNVKLHKDAWPFLYPVNEDDAPGYYEIIKDPIDLSKIENRLFKGEYDTVGDLDEDFSKMVSNCELYNGEYHPYSKMAQTLRKMFRKEVARLLDSLEATENVSADSEGSNDSQYHSSSNSESPLHESSPPHTLVTPKEHKKSKVGRKKKKCTAEALELLAQASDLAVQDNANRASPPEKKSPVPQDNRSAPVYVSSSSMPSNSSTSSSSLGTNKASMPVINSNFAPVNSVVPGVKKNKPVIIRTKALEPDKKTSPIGNVSSTSLSTISNENINNNLPQNNVYQSFKPKTVPVVLSGYNAATSPNQSDLGIKNNPVSTVAMQSNNICMSNGLPVVQQVLFPAGAQQIQMQNNGQFLLASPQNTVRLFGKGQNVQIQNSVGQLNQGFTKVMPQIITSSPIMQVSKDGMQSLQFQALSQNSTQTFTQVAQNPQFVNIPYMFSNQNSVNNTPSQPVVNFQHYQLTPRQNS